MNKKNGWEENRKWIKKELDRHGDTLEKIADKIGEIKEDIAGLKVKAGIWGVIGGSIPVIIAILFILIKKIL